MLSKDGNYFIYLIEHTYNNSDWFRSIENEQYFNASNKCWQETGIHGTFDFDEALKYYDIIRSKPDENNRKFRLVCIRIEQTKTIINC